MPILPDTVLMDLYDAPEKVRQTTEVFALQKFLEDRKHKSVEETCADLRSKGYYPATMRVTWSGGVGSFKWHPRLRRYRVQVSASVWGKPERKPSVTWRGGVPFLNKSRVRFHLKYAICVEV